MSDIDDALARLLNDELPDPPPELLRRPPQIARVIREREYDRRRARSRFTTYAALATIAAVFSLAVGVAVKAKVTQGITQINSDGGGGTTDGPAPEPEPTADVPLLPPAGNDPAGPAVTRPWYAAVVDGARLELAVMAGDPLCQRLSAAATETAGRVEVTYTVQQVDPPVPWYRCDLVPRPTAVPVALDRPLGSRELLDGSNGAPRRALPAADRRDPTFGDTAPLLAYGGPGSAGWFRLYAIGPNSYAISQYASGAPALPAGAQVRPATVHGRPAQVVRLPTPSAVQNPAGLFETSASASAVLRWTEDGYVFQVQVWGSDANLAGVALRIADGLR